MPWGSCPCPGVEMRGSPPLAPPLCVCGDVYLTLPYANKLDLSGIESVHLQLYYIGKSCGALGSTPTCYFPMRD